MDKNRLVNERLGINLITPWGLNQTVVIINCFRPRVNAFDHNDSAEFVRNRVDTTNIMHISKTITEQ